MLCDNGHCQCQVFANNAKLDNEKQSRSLEQMEVISGFGFLLCITVSVMIISDCLLIIASGESFSERNYLLENVCLAL